MPMPARIVVVHDDVTFLREIGAGLTEAGQDNRTFEDVSAAWEALREAKSIEVLITRVQFGPGKPHGLALARWARISCPGIRVLFAASSEFRAEAEEVGLFLPMPVAPS